MKKFHQKNPSELNTVRSVYLIIHNIDFFSPPSFRFITDMWHPNIYENGDVCISILHPPIDDPQSGELPSERLRV